MKKGDFKNDAQYTPTEFIQNVSVFLNELKKGEDGIALSKTYKSSIVKGLHALSSDAFYLSYCLVMAMASDVLRGLEKKEALFDLTAEDVAEQLNKMRFEISRTKQPKSVSQEVTEFLTEVKTLLIKLFWYLIDPVEHEDITAAELASLWQKYQKIKPEDRENKSSRILYYEISDVFTSGETNPSHILNHFQDIRIQ